MNAPDDPSHTRPPGQQVLDAVEPLPGEPIGSYLASHRRLRGISLAELSHLTRIPLRSLERLEQGSFDGHADGFVRGFVRTVAAALGLDAEEAVARLRAEPSSDLRRRPIPRLALGRVFLTFAAVVAVVGLVSLSRSAFDRPATLLAEDVRPTTVRRDPVRALAEAQGVDGLRAGTALGAVGTSRSDDRTSSPALGTLSLDPPMRARTRPGTR